MASIGVFPTSDPLADPTPLELVALDEENYLPLSLDQAVLTRGQPTIEQIGKDFAQAGAESFDTAADRATNEETFGAVGAAAEALFEPIEQVFDAAVGLGRDAAEGVSDFASSGFRAAGELAGSVADTAGDVLEGAKTRLGFLSFGVLVGVGVAVFLAIRFGAVGGGKP